MIFGLLSIIVVAALILGLYYSGLVVLNLKTALFFTMKHKKDFIRFNVKACNGKIVKCIPVKKVKDYTFYMNEEDTKGEIKYYLTNITNKKKFEIRDRDIVRLEASVYKLEINFIKASGKIDVSWIC